MISLSQKSSLILSTGNYISGGFGYAQQSIERSSHMESRLYFHPQPNRQQPDLLLQYTDFLALRHGINACL